jgi:hypothetical protein
VYSKFNLYYYTTTLALLRSLVVQVFLYLGKILPVLVVAAKSNAVPGYYVANTKKVVLAKVEFRLVLKLRRILRSTQIAYSPFGIGTRCFATECLTWVKVLVQVECQYLCLRHWYGSQVFGIQNGIESREYHVPQYTKDP